MNCIGKRTIDVQLKIYTKCSKMKENLRKQLKNHGATFQQ